MDENEMVSRLCRADGQLNLNDMCVLLAEYVQHQGHTPLEFERLLRSLDLNTRCFTRTLTAQEKRDYECLSPMPDRKGRVCDRTIVLSCRPRNDAVAEVLRHNPEGLLFAQQRLNDGGFFHVRSGVGTHPDYDVPIKPLEEM